MDRRETAGCGAWRVFAATGGFIGCVVVAALLVALVGSWGRDLRASGGLAAVFLAAGALGLTGWRGYRVGEMLTALLVAELLFAAVITWYAGAPRLDRLFLSWFLGGNLYLALPWLSGALVGAWLGRRRRSSRKPAM